jgi:PAS domain S-box-containing protein
VSTKLNKNRELKMDDVLEMISGFETGNFSKTLSAPDDHKLKPLVDKLNSAAKILAAQAEIDITERKNAEKEKEPILKRLNYALDASGDGIWDWTPVDGRTVFSKAWIEMLGYKVGELASLASEWSDRLHPDDIEWVFAAINKVTQTPKNGDTFSHEYRFRNKAGDYLWILNKAKVVERNEKGEASRVVGTHTDITERKAAEKLLSESEEIVRRSNQLLESSQAIAQVGGWELDLTTKKLYWTAETYRIHETSPEEFNPSVDAGVDYFLPESKRQISEALELAMTKGVGYDLYLETYTTKGRKINVRTTCAVTLVDKKPTKLTGIFQDITELTRLQDENRFILDALGIGLWKFNPVDQSLFWDQSMYHLYDITEGDFSGHYQAWESTLTPESKAKAVEELGQALRGEKEFDTVFEINTKTGGNRFISGRGKVIRDSSGNPTIMYGVNTDVTKSRIQELQLIALKNQLELVADNMPGPVSQLDRHGRYVYASKMYFEYFGKTPEQILGKTKRELLPPYVYLQAEPNIKRALSGEPVHFELPFVTASGKKLFVQVNMIPFIGQDGKPDGFFSVYHDITALKEAEIKLIHSSKLASLGEMSAGIAHEINNPLAIIDGSANHLLKVANDPEKLNSKVQTIKMAITRISKIVSGLKKFSGSGEKTVYANQSISGLLNDILTLVEVKSGRENVAIKIETKTDAQIFCNSIEIEQVLINLISNAIDAVKSLPEKWVNVSTYDDGKSVVLRVTDSGAGIPKNIREKLFDPFFTTKPTGEGTGLGLSISKGILDEHKASISVLDSCPNTCFEIRFHKVEIANAS